MPLLLNMLSRLVITSLPSSKSLLISWLQSPSAVILEPPKKSDTVSSVSPPICHEVMGPDGDCAYPVFRVRAGPQGTKNHIGNNIFIINRELFLSVSLTVPFLFLAQ